MTIKEALKFGEDTLKAAGIENPQKAANILLQNALDLNQIKVFLKQSQKISSKKIRLYKNFIRRRAKHEPVWYIIGKVEFFGYKFYVNNNVMIPRPETELLIETVLKKIPNKSQSSNGKIIIADVGTGCGNIAITLAKELLKRKITAKIYATDISKKALLVARTNVKNFNLSKTIKLLQGNLLEPLKEKVDIIVANLPYIPHNEINTLALDVYHFEPRVALDGGEKGLELNKSLLKTASKKLKKGGKIFLEVGYNQGKDITKITKRYLPNSKVTVKKDYSNLDRIVIIETL